MYEDENIKVNSYGGRDNSISISGFSDENFEKMLASVKAGAYYVRVDKGKLITVPIWKELPAPTEDKEMTPFWRRNSLSTQPEMFDEYEHSKEKGESPSITIQHLCGYSYSEDFYKENAEKLESYGFECLRSRRGNSGKFWEIWFLPGLYHAKGDLKMNLDRRKDDKKKLLIALEFLRHKVSFGTLDVSNQRVAMVSPD